MSPDDTMAGMQDRIDDYLHFGVPNVWVIDPWKHRGWRVTAEALGDFHRWRHADRRRPCRHASRGSAAALNSTPVFHLPAFARNCPSTSPHNSRAKMTRSPRRAMMSVSRGDPSSNDQISLNFGSITTTCRTPHWL